MRKVFLVLLAAAISAGLFSAREAMADGNIIVHRTSSVAFGNNGGMGYGGNWGWGPFNVNRSLGYIPVPPYFALHPPVYYSHNVAVPYGVSPYAISAISSGSSASASVSGGSYSAPEPKMVINPYYEAEETAEAPAAAEQPVTKVIDAKGSELSHQPQVVHNAS